MNQRFGLMIMCLGMSACVAEEAPETAAAEGQEVSGSAPALAGKEDPGGPITPQGGCNWYTPCGEVQNNSARTISISLNWNCGENIWVVDARDPCVLSQEGLSSGQHRGGGNVDVDAFRVDPGCTYTGYYHSKFFSYGPGWYRFSNLELATIGWADCGVGSVTGGE